MIDQIDRAILQLLRNDPQTSNRSIAQALAVSETTIGVRLERLSSTNVARVIGQRSVRALGWTMSALLDVYLAAGDAEEVISRIHDLENVVTVYQVAGTPELLVKIGGSDIAELTRIAIERIGRDRGVRRVDTYVCLGHGHVRSGFGNLESPRVADPLSGDTLEERITRILARDGRISNREVARAVGVAEATVRARIRNLQQRGHLNYILICNPERVGYTSLAFIRMRVPPREITRHFERLAESPNVFGVTVVTGTHNLLISVYAANWDELWELCTQLSHASADIEDPVIRPVLRFARHRYDMAFTPDPNSI
ncbi:MAG: AsnC family transcriptional regulator [Sphingomonadaceae bacterium]|nr:AsnC family transcriptional regulator [Sphingomonadaceae bacterium]